MTSLRDLLSSEAVLALGLGGFVIGVVFGAITYRTNFCTLGAITDTLVLGDQRRLRAWLLAIATAIVGTQLIARAGLVELDRSMYLMPGLNWAGHVLGGALFGFGMVFAGGCASRNLARAGGGDIRSLLVLAVIGMFAYMTMGGVLGPARVELDRLTAVPLAAYAMKSQSLGEIVAASGVWKIGRADAELAIAGGVTGLIVLFCLFSPSFLRSGRHVLSGLGVGLCVVAAWALTGLAFDELSDKPVAPISLTYVRPVGDTLEWLERFTALGTPSFGVATVLGALTGAFVTAIAMGRFRLTAFADQGDTMRNLFGAMLMGIGGVLALGCTVGQGITGLSTLAVGSFITFGAIVIGAIAGLAALERALSS